MRTRTEQGWCGDANCRRNINNLWKQQASSLGQDPLRLTGGLCGHRFKLKIESWQSLARRAERERELKQRAHLLSASFPSSPVCLEDPSEVQQRRASSLHSVHILSFMC